MLIHERSKNVILNLRDPSRVTSLIPHAKPIELKGVPLLAIPHKVEETRLLRNLGFDVPAPVAHYYQYQGMYEPFAHQRATVEFLTSNPRAFCTSGLGCIAGDEVVRVSRQGKSYEIDLRTLYLKFKSSKPGTAWKARSLKGDRFGMNNLLDVLNQGVKPTLRISLEDGKTFRCTSDHRIARPDGSWTAAGDLRVGDALVTNGQVALTCHRCGNARLVSENHAKYRPNHQCTKCKAAQVRESGAVSGANNPAWKGGRFTDPDGYVNIYLPGHHRQLRGCYVYEHIVVAEAAFGITVTPDLHVHHKNGVKDDNRPENLEVLSAADHHRLHDPRPHLDGAVSAKGGVVVVLPKEAAITAIEDGGEVDVYDLCMEAPHHNFVVNGVVVHNSGKTLCGLWSYDFLRNAGEVNKVLVVGPLSTLERAWGDEIIRNFPHLEYAVLHGALDKRMKLLARDDIDIYIINHDGLGNKEVLDALCMREDIDLVIVDELAVYRNKTTERWKCLDQLINGKRTKGTPDPRYPVRQWAWGFTGTPIPNAPTDAWAQCRLLNPSRAPRSFGEFRNLTMRQLTQFKWVPKPDALDTVYKIMQPSIRFAREDCIDLPPTTYMTREVELTKEQQRAYDEMLKHLRAVTAAGELTAANEAVKLGRLLQICAGGSYAQDGAQVHLPCGPRIREVLDVIEEADAKVIVFVPYTAALELVAQEIGKHYSTAVVHGQTPKTQRDEIFGSFQNAQHPHVLVANPGTVSHGLTLTAADTIVWYAPVHSNEIWEQANGRIARPGQKRNTRIISIEGSTAERRVYERLQNKGRVQGVLLDMLKEGAPA